MTPTVPYWQMTPSILGYVASASETTFWVVPVSHCPTTSMVLILGYCFQYLLYSLMSTSVGLIS